jgi:superfamily II DNA or RNA helicase
MEDVDDIAVDRDLFGEPVAEAKPRRKAVARPAGRIGAPSAIVPVAAAPVIALKLPERYALRGKIQDNELQQLAVKGGSVTGYLTEIPTRTGSSYSFEMPLGQRIRIVPRRTTATLGDDPILLAEGATSPAEIQSALEDGRGVWLGPRPSSPADFAPDELTALCAAVIASWREQFVFREAIPASADTPAVPGLRRPQVGALHAALAHATSSIDPATIVMPTGTGKTETMLAIHAHERITRLMVVVPTDALREQIGRKFETMGILQDQECLAHDILYPVVLRLNHIPKAHDDVDALFGCANVIITTISIAGRAVPEVQERMAQTAGALFIDEAHHIKAPTWREFRAWFMRAAGGKPIYQFTATPFREDGGKVDGKFIYYYPLRKAQEEGYFGKVEFRAVSEMSGAEADAEIARMVGETLRRDSAMNLNHLAMARCKTIKRAREVHAVYARELPDYRPVLVHSDMPAAERRDNLAKLKSFESRLIVCVDMLGEGFDLPELKIAALHDVFKSVAVTLQFVGRFTRSRSDLGTATLIANTDQDRIDRALSKLYAEEADWNFLIANLSADRVGRAMDRAALFDGFQGDLHEVPLQTIEPSMNAVVFKTPGCERWNLHGIEDEVPTGSFVGMKVNELQRLAVCVLRHETQSKWTRSSKATDVTWELVLAHWDEAAQLLYLSSTGGSVTDALARTIGGDGTTRIRGQQVFRCFHEFRQLVIRNLGDASPRRWHSLLNGDGHRRQRWP